MVHKDGHIIWVKEIARQAINPDGKIVILIASQDITARKKAEAVSRISEGKYQDLYDNAPDMYVSVDAASALIIDCNQTMVKMLGYAKDEIVGRPIFDMYDPNCRDDVKKAFQAFQETGEVHSAELQVRRKDGTRIDISLNVSAVRDGEGKVLYSRACWTDITDRKKKENEILRLNQELEERVAARTTELTEKAEDLSRSQQALQYLLEDVNQAKKELETKIAEIERMNRIFVHRELRMVELKEKIKEMEQEQHSSVGTDPGGRA
jgi:PAS domain S-box-containing protein